MNITDELRDCIRTANRSYEDVRNPYNDMEILHIPDEELLKIADRIDREHRMAMEKVAAEADALPMTDESMAEHGWIRLPLDADGVPIHFGDLLTEHEDGCTFKVDGFQIWGWSKEWWVYQEEGVQAPAKICAHHHAPTVEDVLREFADRVCNSGHQWGLDAAGTIAEYAERLRLAEGADA